MKRQIGISKINLDVRKLGLDLDNFTNARFYRVRRTIKKINACGTKFLVLEIDDEELPHPDTDVLILAAVMRGKYCSRYVVWDDMVWLVADNDLIDIISGLATLPVGELRNSAEFLNAQGQGTDEGSESPPAG